MSQRLKLIAILVVSLPLSGCLTWPEESSGSAGGPFASAPPSERSGTRTQPTPQPQTPESTGESGASSPLDSPVVVYRPQPRFEPVVVDTAPQVPAESAPREIVVPRGSGGQGNAAVKSLVAKADAAYDRGEYEAAIAQLERAVRIEPRNSHVWYKMANLRMALQEPVKAESLAQKSLSFAGADKKLQADNWDLIAVTRRMRGDTPGANFAARQATLALQKQ